jgi:hypothetical protein
VARRHPFVTRGWSHSKALVNSAFKYIRSCTVYSSYVHLENRNTFEDCTVFYLMCSMLGALNDIKPQTETLNSATSPRNTSTPFCHSQSHKPNRVAIGAWPFLSWIICFPSHTKTNILQPTVGRFSANKEQPEAPDSWHQPTFSPHLLNTHSALRQSTCPAYVPFLIFILQYVGRLRT